jgi:hypothetical protein
LVSAQALWNVHVVVPLIWYAVLSVTVFTMIHCAVWLGVLAACALDTSTKPLARAKHPIAMLEMITVFFI